MARLTAETELVVSRIDRYLHNYDFVYSSILISTNDELLPAGYRMAVPIAQQCTESNSLKSCG